MRAKKFELWFGCLGNGITVCNKAVEEHGDYKYIAHIGEDGTVSWRVDKSYVPPEDMVRIEAEAAACRRKYQEWWNSLPEAEQYRRTLDKMSCSELVEHIKRKRSEKE